MQDRLVFIYKSVNAESRMKVLTITATLNTNLNVSLMTWDSVKRFKLVCRAALDCCYLMMFN